MLTPHTSNENAMLIFETIIPPALKLSIGIYVSMLHQECSIEILKVQHSCTFSVTIV